MTVQEKIEQTRAAIVAEAERRGLAVEDAIVLPCRPRVRIAGVLVELGEQHRGSALMGTRHGLGLLTVTVNGVHGYPRMVFPTKTFPEGKQGVNIGKVLDRVEEVIAARAAHEAAEEEKASSAQETAANVALRDRKAAALDKLDAHDGWWREENGDLYWNDQYGVIRNAASLLELAEALPEEG